MVLPRSPAADGEAPRSKACLFIKGTTRLTPNKSYKYETTFKLQSALTDKFTEHGRQNHKYFTDKFGD